MCVWYFIGATVQYCLNLSCPSTRTHVGNSVDEVRNKINLFSVTLVFLSEVNSTFLSNVSLVLYYIHAGCGQPTFPNVKYSTTWVISSFLIFKNFNKFPYLHRLLRFLKIYFNSLNFHAYVIPISELHPPVVVCIPDVSVCPSFDCCCLIC